MSCTKEQPKPEIVKLSTSEASQNATKIRKAVTTELGDGLNAQLWASEQLMADPTALDINNKGEAYVAITKRRRSNGFMNAFHERWTIRSSSFTTVEERKKFLKRVLAPKNSKKNEWLPDRNGDGSHDWRDLTVQKEKILKIKDTNGDGIADQSQQYFEGFHTLVTGTIGAVLNTNKSVYAGVTPNLWRLKDQSGDGVADEKESLSYGYGVRIGIRGHNMSGLIKGPDGRLYWSSGSHGINVKGPDGKRWKYPDQGVIMRCEPDGSDLQVFARGLRNTYGIAFDKYGNLIAVDNDGDYKNEYERIVYLTKGSDSGWRSNWQYGKFSDPKNNGYNPWIDENYFKVYPNNQASFLLPPIAPYKYPPAGIAYNPGTALGGEWQNYFFVGGFAGSLPKSGIDAFKLKPHGASFALEDEQKILRGILVTNLDFGPDGALYMTDWVEGWTADGKGRIWKLANAKEHRDLNPNNGRNTKTILADDFTQQSKEYLLSLLKYPDLKVRKKAQFELARRGEAQLFLKAVKQTKYQIERIHGIWGLWQLARQNKGTAKKMLTQFLDDSDPEIRAQTAKVLGDVHYQPVATQLIHLLKDESNRVAFFATQALGELQHHPAIQPIVEMLASHEDKDVYMQHAGTVALARIGDAKAIAKLANNPFKEVRIAAVVALRRLESPKVVLFLNDHNQSVVTAAARAINDDVQIKQAIPQLAEMLGEHGFTNEPLVRREINACLYSGKSEDAERLALFASRKGGSDEMRIEALRTLGMWPNPSTLDRVTGRYRGKLHHDTADAREALAGVVSKLLNQVSSEIRATAAKTVSQLKYRPAASQLFEMVKNDNSPKVRIAALQSLQDLKYKNLDQAVRIALQDQNKDVRDAVIDMIPGMDLPQEEIVKLLEFVLQNGSVVEQQSALQNLGEMHSEKADQVLKRKMNELNAGELAPEIELDLLDAVKKTQNEELLNEAMQYRDSKPKDDSLAKYHEVLKGGHVEAGRNLFFHNEKAQCVRCHAVDGSGGNVGPDLSHIGTELSRRQLLQALVEPSARIAPRFGNVTVTLKSGNTVQGMLYKETDSYLVIQTESNHKQKIQRSEIVKRKNETSAMPPMGVNLNRHQLRNLVEFLNSRK